MELGTETIGHVVARLLDKPNARADRDRTIPTGLRLLDEILAGGLRTGQTTVVAGRSGDGASTFAWVWLAPPHCGTGCRPRSWRLTLLKLSSSLDSSAPRPLSAPTSYAAVG